MMLSPWPWPTLFAHRGGGALAPENTLAGMLKAVEHRFAAVEFDVKLSRDRVCIVLHDDTLERTTNGHGAAAGQTWEQLARLDAGSWFGPAFAGTALPTLEAVAACCLSHDLLVNAEIKPCPGREVETGECVASELARLWRAAPVLPLVSSFSYPALQAAHAISPRLPLGWLLESWEDDWQDKLAAIDAVSLHCDEQLLTPERVEKVRSAGYRVLAYTVNEAARARALLGWGVDGLFTDALDSLPAALRD
ncbi:glycerophosphodiester phosphodiesterase [Paludibacterium yongneupense]|uniref:glycerophosphodiester phosphodiesterase n=1 Tax=Paludibacterium yongneupense TaxID=400061 RepID=UPI00040CBF82|nr:glycerophosphodiester phosphodiesterase [Paludibacterium yongneupense]